MMGGMSWIHWAIVIAIVALLFGGRGKISGVMADAAKGLKAFKDGLKGDDAETEKTTAALIEPARDKDQTPVH